MKLKITILAFLAFTFGFHKMEANAPLSIEGEAASVMMTTNDNSLIVSAGCHIYTVNMESYQATLLTSSPYVSEINSLAVDASTGWIFYVSNQASRYNWTVYGYNVYTNTHKSFGDIRSYFTATGHAYSSRGLGSGGATFYNGKLYFAMEYPTNCYNYRTSSGVVNVKDELKRELEGVKINKGSLINTSAETNTGRSTTGDILPSYNSNETIRNDKKEDNSNIRDYESESSLLGNTNSLSGSSESSNERYGYSSYNNRIYLLEVCFNNLSDFSGDSSSISNASPKYDNNGHSSFLYKGELGDIAASDEGEIYAVTTYQIQHFDFDTNTFCWANNEDVYAQIAKDKNSNLHLLKNIKTCSHSGSCYTSCTRKSYVQSYTQPNQLQTYNNIQLGSLIEIQGLSSEDRGKITDAADYLNLVVDVEVSYNLEGTVFDDDNQNGSQETEEANLEDIRVTLYADSNNDGILDDNDVQLDITSTDENGYYNFTDISEEDILVVVTVPEDTEEITYTSTTDDVIVITSTEDVTGVDFGIDETFIISYYIEGVVFDDDNSSATYDDGEAYLNNIPVVLYADTNNNGVLDADDLKLEITTSDENGYYSFTNVSHENVFVVVVTPEDSNDNLYTLTTEEIVTISSTEDVTGVDFGINEEIVERFNISGVVWDDNNRDGVKDPSETPLPNIIVNLFNDVNGNGILDSGDEYLETKFTSFANPNYSFNDVTPGNKIVYAITPQNNPPFLWFFTTFDLDNGTQNPDGIYAFDLQETTENVDFGIDRLSGNSKVAAEEEDQTKEKSEDPLNNNEAVVQNPEVRAFAQVEQDLDAESLELFNGIKLYPNPSTKFIIVKSDLLDENTVVNIYSITGKLIMTKDYSEESSLSEVKFNLDKLSAGLYLAKISTGNNKTIVKRFVKQ
ncbi:SdrD B-like domain-containing protein [Oceanihabitans sp. 2_MG-2023]|uniref:SdrD B-like domain-containing protein n=1 Tax=Oceanihabitans sp. 2_MG-2023 TaxID=3062661 RepID=UPI0026E2C524|nr:SdrD B-like domain-containing protein [Oceanihabitans sp. 2_MG-2023]MDO6595905.1 SdrD B-like domain-containing protein [Oceanihabitans sp. 2_MG-2023]